MLLEDIDDICHEAWELFTSDYGRIPLWAGIMTTLTQIAYDWKKVMGQIRAQDVKALAVIGGRWMIVYIGWLGIFSTWQATRNVMERKWHLEISRALEFDPAHNGFIFRGRFINSGRALRSVRVRLVRFRGRGESGEVKLLDTDLVWSDGSQQARDIENGQTVSFDIGGYPDLAGMCFEVQRKIIPAGTYEFRIEVIEGWRRRRYAQVGVIIRRLDGDRSVDIISERHGA